MNKNEIEAINKQLKPCPCCGSEAIAAWDTRWEFGIFCHKCRITLEAHADCTWFLTFIPIKTEDIIDRWNSRTNGADIWVCGVARPCPLCGNADPSVYMSRGSLWTVGVLCNECNIDYSETLAVSTESKLDVQRRVIDGWNRRVGDQA